VHIYIFWPKLLRWNFFLLQISQLSILSGAHKVFRRFLDFSQFFYRTFANIVAKSNDENENCAARLEGLSILKKVENRIKIDPLTVTHYMCEGLRFGVLVVVLMWLLTH